MFIPVKELKAFLLINCYQGESLASIIESFVRASHVNVTKSLSTPTGGYMLLQSAMYARIGDYTQSLSRETPLTTALQERLIFRG
jgi:hypothetical protein